MTAAAAYITPEIVEAALAEAATMGGDELTTALPVPAELAHRLFVEVERVPGWLSIVRSARVLSRTDDDRPHRVAFLAELERGTIGYTVEYRYDDPGLRVLWATPPDGSIRVAGEASFSPLGEGACMMYYRLGLEVPGVGSWGDPSFDGHAASAVVHDFRDFVRRGV